MATRGKKTSVHTCAKNHIPKKVIMIMSVVITAFNRKAVRLVGYIYGGVFIFGFFLFLFWIFFVFRGFWLLASVASGFCGFWLLWLLAFVAFGFRGFRGFCGFWLLWLLAFWPIHLSVYTYLFIYLTFFLSFFWQLFSFLFLYLLFLLFSLQRRNQTRKQASKQANKQARAAHLWIWCAAGGSALHPRHPRLPRNQYFKVNSPVQNFLTKQICLLYLSIYLSILSYLILSNLI